MTIAMTTIAVIGTGNMGSPMAINLKKGGFKVIAYDLIEQKLEALIPHGIVKSNHHRDAIENADIIITMLPSGVEVQSVYNDSILKFAKPGTLLIDCSTIDTAESKDIHQKSQALGFPALDAPVSGGTVGAKNGTLSFMVGGDAADLERARPAFDAMGKAIIHCGPAGMGQAAKMCNNMMLAIQMSSVAEGFRLAEECGLESAKLFDVALASSGNCFALTTFCPIPNLVETAPSSNDYRAGFSAALMQKDLTLALKAADRSNLNLTSAKAAAIRYQELIEQGREDIDFSAIYTNIN